MKSYVEGVGEDRVSVWQAHGLVEAAHRAQADVARFNQAKIDRICEAMVRAALREAARLGAMAVEETGYGISTDKKQKKPIRRSSCVGPLSQLAHCWRDLAI